MLLTGYSSYQTLSSLSNHYSDYNKLISIAETIGITHTSELLYSVADFFCTNRSACELLAVVQDQLQ